MRTAVIVCVAVWMLCQARTAVAGDPLTLASATEPVAIAADEPFADAFSLELAAQNLDNTALHWQREHQCAACHTLPPYLMARPLLSSVAPEPPEVRAFFERIVNERLEGEPELPQDGISAVIIQTAAALAFHDRATTGTLHPATRTQLDRCGRCSAPMEAGMAIPRYAADQERRTLWRRRAAALAAGAAPDDYAASDAARHGLENIRRYLAANPALQPASAGDVDLGRTSRTPGSRLRCRGTIDRLREVQARADGGWSLASLMENPDDPQRQTDGRATAPPTGTAASSWWRSATRPGLVSSLASDGYATGFTLYVLRQARRFRGRSGNPAGHRVDQGEPAGEREVVHAVTKLAYAALYFERGERLCDQALAACGEATSDK
ncbi:MAG: hypothetical protein U0992_02700 [Planctomycetaceae bacterium]